MKISFLTPHLKLKGGIRRVIELSNNLIDRGYKVSIFHSDGSACNWLKTKAEIKSLKDFFEFEHERIVYYDQDDYKNVLKVKAEEKFFYCCNLYSKKNLLKPIFFLYFIDSRAYKLKRIFLNKKHKIIVNCHDSQEWLKKYIDKESGVVLGGVKKSMFYPVDVAKNKDVIKILCLGGDRKWKGTQIIRKAVGLAQKENKKIILEELTGKGLPQNKLASEYSSADLFVDAQYYAGWNNPIAEAMACKVPVVCTDIGQNKELALNNKTALIVPVGDYQKMADAILKLIGNSELANSMIKNAYNNVSKFTWEKATEQLVKILNSNK